MENDLPGDISKSISKWIGGGDKQFILLYSASHHGCNPEAFHARCDNKGPTLTVVSNTNGNIYGGYARVNWMSGYKGLVYDEDAFLFAFERTCKRKETKFVVETPKHALLMDVCSGPAFGIGPDFQVFKNKTKTRKTTFRLDSVMKPTSYRLWSQMNIASLTGTNEVNDVQVFAVTSTILPLTRPFNDDAFVGQCCNDELLKKLQDEVEDYWPLKIMGVTENRIPYVNILLLGPVGAGKSSFFNTLSSIFLNRLSLVARAGRDTSSLTKNLRIYSLVFNGKKLKFRIVDCRGFDEVNELHITDMNGILDGHVKDRYVFNDKTPITKESHYYRQNPEMHDRIHCVVFVVDGNKDPDYPMQQGVLEQIKTHQESMNSKEIPQLLLLTKMDGVLKDAERTLSSVFHSPDIKSRVDKVSTALGLTPNTVLPMKNMTSEQVPTMDIAILALYNLRQMLNAADDYLLNYLDDFFD